MVVDEDLDRIVGFTVALPTDDECFGKTHKMLELCRFFNRSQSIEPLGIAAKLRRGAKDAIDAGQYQFLYAHPNERMLVSS